MMITFCKRLEEYSNGGNATALIWGASPQMRSDRRKDRVETNPELLAAASAQAEKMTLTTGRTTRVIGWYHSHPHITVLPSHVDVRTQAMYQLLDTGFIGLIFSCFSEDAQKVGRIQVIAFQSLNGKEMHVTPFSTSSIIEDTADSRETKAIKVGGGSSALEDSYSQSDVNYSGKQRDRGNSLVTYGGDSTFDTLADTDSMDMTPSMQEALHRSNLEVSGAEYVRKEVPLKVVPASSLLKLEHPLNSFTDLQEVLFEEEQAAYKEAISHNIQDGKIHPLTFIHHNSTYQATLCKLMEYCLSPAISALQDTLKENEIRLSILMKEAKSLETEGHGRENDSSFGSPRRASRRRAF
ncbi:Ubiquitinyl hydrolase 1 protein [Dioscorea alata]|uniref:Ubiquitinyl hydrolase 1 protein n=1 Tax=Dioscorea alata TaxID=55571 RepID=A0ACB7WFB5_DIOAL|nr:Ubiquitinyl hydrolase 1 protein [Dioscorea alata]